MPLQTDLSTLQSAWRALANDAEGKDGWNTIPVASGASFCLMAARDFPGGYEAVLVGFNSGSTPSPRDLPNGQGFEVKVVSYRQEDYRLWIALSRSPAGPSELFVQMVLDLLQTLRGTEPVSGRALSTFLARIRAWQAFMHPGAVPVLRPEEEIGLFGELVVLAALHSAGLPAQTAVHGWQGPDDGLQDFAIGSGAIEVKTTLGKSSFPARINGLDQLDDTILQPLYLAAVRLSVNENGQTLPEHAMKIIVGLADYKDDIATKLIRAGLLPDKHEAYNRRFSVESVTMLLVDSAFPRLVRGNVDPAITHAVYVIDLHNVRAGTTTLGDVVRTLWSA